jgi:hypothetical protein
MNPEQFFGGQVGHFGGLDYSHYLDEDGQLYAVANKAQMDALMKPMKFTPEMLEKLMDVGKPSDEEMARQAEEIDRALAPKFHFKSF